MNIEFNRVQSSMHDGHIIIMDRFKVAIELEACRRPANIIMVSQLYYSNLMSGKIALHTQECDSKLCSLYFLKGEWGFAWPSLVGLFWK